ncbi:MAG TPA: hypothetical protein DEQ43_20755, partial [Nocardioides bacterium]|nr:hypothetical protein [Nocardioides sp.]
MHSRILRLTSALVAAAGVTWASGALSSTPVAAVEGHRLSSVAWREPTTPVSGGLVSFDVVLDAGPESTIVARLTGAVVDTIPDGCEPSSVVRARSRLEDDGATLICEPPGGGPTDLRVDVRTGTTPGPITASVEEAGQSQELPELTVATGRTDTPRTLRLISSPDFLNADVADLRRGPNAWRPRRSSNGTSPAYEGAIGAVLDDWARQAPDAVLVAGDLVNGRWDRDDHHTGTFGPLRTRRERARAVHRAAATYYPQYLERFRERGLALYPAIGDHEYGDNPWRAEKRRLAPVFAREFARHFTRAPGGQPRFADHPGGRHAGTAYAWRPAPDVQVVSIDPFDITRGRSRIRLDEPQRRWLVGVLRRAQADGVRWTIVQGHVPVLEPVRARGSSELHYPGGPQSELWRIFERYGVDLYLC